MQWKCYDSKRLWATRTLHFRWRNTINANTKQQSIQAPKIAPIVAFMSVSVLKSSSGLLQLPSESHSHALGQGMQLKRSKEAVVSVEDGFSELFEH